MRARRYEALNRQLARAEFELPTEYETASGDDLSDEIQERFRDEAHSTVRCGTEICPESAVVRFPRSRLTAGESGRVFLDGRLVSIGKKYGELLLGAVRWWGVYLPREGVVVVWSDWQTHDGGSATLVRRVRPQL